MGDGQIGLSGGSYPVGPEVVAIKAAEAGGDQHEADVLRSILDHMTNSNEMEG